LEKEVSNCKIRVDELQTEVDTLTDENKKLQLKSQKRLPMTTQENVYVENQVLQDKVKRLEKRMKDATLKLKHAESVTNLSNGGGGDKDAEISELKNRINELSGNTPDAIKKLLSGRTPKVPKDTTPKITLVKWVNELETECGE